MTVRCDCEKCVSFKKAIEERGEPLTFKGFPILTEHEAAMVDFPYPPEPEPE